MDLVGLRRYQEELRERAGLPPEEKPVPRPTQSSGVDAINMLATMLGQKGIA